MLECKHYGIIDNWQGHHPLLLGDVEGVLAEGMNDENGG